MESNRQLRDEVMDLHARYANAIDDGDAEAWARCFTPDGVLRTNRPLEVTGRPALRAFAESWIASRPGPSRHITWHHLVLEAELAGRCSAGLLVTMAEGVSMSYTAVYRDRFERVRAEWLLKERVVAIDRPERWES
ncbi:nuclear transport factor 2 family protein [Acrocarpospora sp. B8E8]|uniref:nuclear transport factor 2 family protein n=1 Tax=Acrocarpospora sp. B8E8 TaxID=3153572 RepID=UPI00325CE795